MPELSKTPYWEDLLDELDELTPEGHKAALEYLTGFSPTTLHWAIQRVRMHDPELVKPQ